MFEALEKRQMFAVVPNVALPGGGIKGGTIAPAPVTTTKTPLIVDGTSGNDHIRLESNNNGLISVVRENVIVSNHVAADISLIQVRLLAGDDSLTMGGTFRAGIPVEVYAGTGNDIITGSNLSERLFGENGNDSIRAGGGNDTVQGGYGDDSIFGEGGVDSISGGAGRDRIDIANGTAHGDGDADNITGGTAGLASVYLYGDQGNDTLHAGPNGRTTLHGGAGFDTLVGGMGDDELYGEGQNDKLTGGSGHDRMFGGDGDDTIYANNDGSPDGISGGAGYDTAYVDDRSHWFAFWEVQDSWSTVEKVHKS